jgi:hypothetical protein
VKALRTSSDARLREAAAFIIGNSGHSELTPLVAKSLADSSEQVRRAGITALQKLVNPQALSLDPAGDRLVLPDPPSLPPDAGELCTALRPLLRDPSPLVRAPAAETLGWLRCNAFVSDLQMLMRDRVEPVRFRASHALGRLTGIEPNFINPDDLARGRPPLMTVREAVDADGAQQAGPFVRSAFFEKQGKFSYRGGVPAQYQTVLRIWRAGSHLEFEVECQDERPDGRDNDKLSFYLRPLGLSRLYRFDVVPERGLVRQALESPAGAETDTSLGASASVERNDREWKARLTIPLAAFGLKAPPTGEAWEANVVRVESHHATGWGPEISSWAYFDRDFPGPPRLGNLYFADDALVVELRPEPENVYTYPFDQDSAPEDQTRSVQPTHETLWGDIVAPDHLVKGTNAFFVAEKLWPAGQNGLLLTVKVSSYKDRRLILVENLPVSFSRQSSAQKVEVQIPQAVEARAIDLEFVVSDGKDRHELFRTQFICVPLVSPPRTVSSYHLSRIQNEKGLWSSASGASSGWTVHDFGPMLMNESYPMALIEGQDGTLYGGTYPGGRLFSFRPATGTLEDLGSPGPPGNHLTNLVASSDGMLYGDLYRPLGRVFSYNPGTRTSQDLGVAVPGAFSGECRVMAWAGGAVYGTQRGHLFLIDSATHHIVDKGSFLLNGNRYIPLQVASDAQGNVLGIAGGRLFQYLPKSDEVRLSDVELDGWLLPGPQGRVYTLFLDGRLFTWKPVANELVQVARYAPIAIETGPLYARYRFRGVLLALAATGELIEAHSGIDDPRKTTIRIYRPGGSLPVNLGNPVPGAPYLTSLAIGSDGNVYGMSTERVYGLDRTPVHLYSLTRGK